jgi:small subunit ribosomal protein S6
MAANVYECMFLLDTNKVAGDAHAAAKQLHAVLEKNHAEVLASRSWDERRLAYPIKGHKKGLYYLIYFRTEGNNLAPIENDFSLMRDLVLRTLTLNIDPKLVDAMLNMARDEHAFALATVNEPPEDEALLGTPAGGGGGGERDGERPRRGGRHMAEAEKE